MKNCFSTLAVFLCRSNFLVDSSLAVFWVSLKFEERSEDMASFPLTLNKFFTSCARWHKHSNWANILTFDFYPKYFHKNPRHGAIFDLNIFIFEILTATTVLRCTPWHFLSQLVSQHRSLPVNCSFKYYTEEQYSVNAQQRSKRAVESKKIREGW